MDSAAATDATKLGGVVAWKVTALDGAAAQAIDAAFGIALDGTAAIGAAFGNALDGAAAFGATTKGHADS